ncbi:MAG: cytochrome c5 family protein [Gammaproteobacteria bacterium TMED134]|nr:MAG: cytochrome c5 family protein [Gammaproteobacteria bacterium TMED134]RPG47060.1 MAG: cytochrome c5 family protein [Gammaproteobacteria bacterium TMED134]HBK18288.1 cytochrome C [Gammaproteobacteria bacterium]
MQAKSLVFVAALAFVGVFAHAVPPGTKSDIDQRLQPMGMVNRAAAVDESLVQVAAAPLSGEDVYGQYCAVCHAGGVGGAPLFADQQVWAPRIAKGMEVLMDSTLNGINAMPARGTCMSCSDEDLGAAVTYMLEAAE